jgi:hypothetical protein
MDLAGYLSLFARILSDWRIAFIAVATLLAWAALRYVGMVYDRRPRRPAPRTRPTRPASRPASPPARASRASAPAEEEEEGTIR